MPSIFDLMPASLWPVQPFIPPPDPAQPPAWPSWASGWTPAVPSPPPSWPTAATDAPADADSSVSDWDRAMRQALAAQAGATRDPGTGGIASDRALADARRAHDFVRWMFGPPSAPQARQMGDAMLRGGSQYVTGAPPNEIAASADAVPVLSPGASDANAQPPLPASQQPDVGAAVGNPNIERQGARARAIAATRPPPAPAIADIWPEIGHAASDAIHNINAGLNPFSAEARAALDAPRPATMMDRLAADWEDKKRVGRGLLGIPQLAAAPITGLSRSLLGHGLQWFDANALRNLAIATFGEDKVRQLEQARGSPGGLSYEDAKHAVDQIMMGLAPRGGLPRTPLAPAPRALPAPPIEPGGAAGAVLPHVDPATVPLVPVDPPDPATVLAAARLRGEIDMDALSARARQIHGALGARAQKHRTAAVLSTDGPTIIGGGKRDLDDVQTRLLQDGEIAAKLPGADAEPTVLSEAMARGHRPLALATSRPICPDCAELIKSMGGKLTSATTAIFPPQ
jgi:hypothetical protein